MFSEICRPNKERIASTGARVFPSFAPNKALG
jgi:hypothetical protein